MAPDASAKSRPLLSLAWLVPWAALLTLALVVGVGLGAEGADYPTPFAVGHAYRLVVGAELFFLLVVVPAAASGGTATSPPGLLELVLLLALGAPAVVVASWVADSGWAQAAGSQGYLLVAAALVAGYLGMDRGGRWRGPYWVALAALGVGAPLLAFVVGDLVRAPLEWLYCLSPFWVADRLCRPWRFGWGWAAPSAGLLALAIAFLAWPRPRR